MLTHEYLYVLAVLFFALSSNYVLICALMQFVENKSFHFRIIALIYIYVTCPKYLFLEFFRTFLHSSHLKKQCIFVVLPTAYFRNRPNWLIFLRLCVFDFYFLCNSFYYSFDSLLFRVIITIFNYFYAHSKYRYTLKSV